MIDYLSLIDRHTLGPRDDVTPLFADYSAFTAAIDAFDRQMAHVEFDLVAGIDALGFVLGTALALRRRVGLVTLRKGGKLPVETDSVTFTDYTGQTKRLELRTNVIRAGMRVLIADDWIETGAQVRAAAQLVERQGGSVIGLAVIHADRNAQTRPLFEQFPCFALHFEEQHAP